MKVFPVARSVQDTLKRMVIAAWPALAILFLTLVISVFFSEITFTVGMESIWKIPLRLKALPIVPIEAQELTIA